MGAAKINSSPNLKSITETLCVHEKTVWRHYNRFMYRVILFLALSLTAAAQTPAPNSPVLEALLTEIRGLRQDLQTTAATIQRVQILMFRVQTEAQFLSRATEHADQAHQMCANIQQQRTMVTQEIARLEANPPDNVPGRPSNAENLARMKSNLESTGVMEQQCRSREIDASAQLRDEQAKMNDLQDQLDKLDKTLATIGRQK